MTPPPNSTRWTPSAAYLARAVHLLAGALLVMLDAAHGAYPWYAVFGVMVGAAIKEFTLDIYVIEHDSFAGSLEDWFFYVVGAVLAVLALVYLWAGVLVGSVLLALMAFYDWASDGEPYD